MCRRAVEMGLQDEFLNGKYLLLDATLDQDPSRMVGPKQEDGLLGTQLTRRMRRQIWHYLAFQPSETGTTIAAASSVKTSN